MITRARIRCPHTATAASPAQVATRVQVAEQHGAVRARAGQQAGGPPPQPIERDVGGGVGAVQELARHRLRLLEPHVQKMEEVRCRGARRAEAIRQNHLRRWRGELGQRLHLPRRSNRRFR